MQQQLGLKYLVIYVTQTNTNMCIELYHIYCTVTLYYINYIHTLLSMKCPAGIRHTAVSETPR